MRSFSISVFLQTLQDLVEATIEIESLPQERRWFRSCPFFLKEVTVELVQQEGTLRLRVSRAIPVNPDYVKKFFVGIFRDLCEKRILRWPSTEHAPSPNYNDVYVTLDFGVRNGENFTETAVDHCITLFQRLGIKVYAHPLVGKFTQTRMPYDAYWHDFGLHLYYDRLNQRGIHLN